jgi:hypothetical protein
VQLLSKGVVMTQPTEHRPVTAEEAHADYQTACLQVRVLEDAIRLQDQAIVSSLEKAECVTVTPTYIDVQPTAEFWQLLDRRVWLQRQLLEALAGRQYAYDVWQSILAHTPRTPGVDTNVSTHPDMPSEHLT